jgi:hypothetical protein
MSYLIGLLAISVIVNIIMGFMLRRKRIRRINDHNKSAYERKKFIIELQDKKEQYSEKIKKSKDVGDYIRIYNDIMSNNNN